MALGGGRAWFLEGAESSLEDAPSPTVVTSQ